MHWWKCFKKRNLLELKPQNSIYKNKLQNKHQVIIDLPNKKNPSKSLTLKDFIIFVTLLVQNSNHFLEDLKLLSNVLAA